MNKYEVMYVIDPTLEDSVRNELISYFSGIVEKNAGMIDRIDEWGKRRLAYAINYKTEGYYVLMYIQGPSELPRELERNFKINDKVLRYLVIRYEGELPAKREPLKPYVAREAAPAQAAEEKPAEVA
ncbi:MAG: 30S ribosomal protein S6, partial [Eubacteriales bacterium]|nr:30S ribosomal protein S6 [Clostridiales bacterium]MDY2602283.1 30S ribosomal protein S6 [Eubacteriales bacterium]